MSHCKGNVTNKINSCNLLFFSRSKNIITFLVSRNYDKTAKPAPEAGFLMSV